MFFELLLSNEPFLYIFRLGLDSWLERFFYFWQKGSDSLESQNSRLDPPLLHCIALLCPGPLSQVRQKGSVFSLGLFLYFGLLFCATLALTFTVGPCCCWLRRSFG
jgi:hypothetical protein